MRKKYLQPISTIVMTLFVLTSFTLFFQAQDAFAVVIVGEDVGLRVALSNVPTPTDNLNPGDTKTSIMTISNEGSFSLPITLTGSITNRALGRGGGDLDKQLTIKVLNPNDEIVYEGSMSGMSTPIPLGSLAPSGSKDLRFMVNFPEDTPNAYQASSLTVQWTVTAPTPYYPPVIPPPVVPPPVVPPPVIPPPIVPPPVVPPPVVPPPVVPPPILPPGEEIVIVPPEEVPAGIAELPKTGETNPAIFYGLGAALIGFGLMAGRKRRQAKH